MNVEGALYVDGALKLFGRGNGAIIGELRPINASCDVVWTDLVAHLEHPSAVSPPTPRDIIEYDLGTLGTLATISDAITTGASALRSVT